MDVNEDDIINRRYILNSGNDPTKILEPIWGYAREPLLPLVDACRPLLRIVSRLEPHIWVALENSRNPADNLTQDESAAIRLYTMEWEPMDGEHDGSLYRHLNHTLKEADRAELRPWFRYLKLFVTGLAKIPISQHHVIWRGVRKDFSMVYVPGIRVTWWPFSSCTTSLSVLESDLYLGNAGTRTLFSIEALNGRTIRDHSRFTTEDEILLLPGTHLEVVSQLNPAPDLFIIHLRQIMPPHELLEPPFKDAHLFPTSVDSNTRKEIFDDESHHIRPWYKMKKVWVGFGVAIVLIIIAIILGAVLGIQTENNGTPTNTTTVASTTTTTPFYFNASANTTVVWSNGNWSVRNEQNFQSDASAGLSNWTSNNVVLDSVQGLYMRLTRNNVNQWWCSQVQSEQQYSFGNFTFFINASLDKFDPNVELRMFTQNGDNQTNGISVDIGRHGQTNSSANGLWYTIYPNTLNGSTINYSTQFPNLTGTYTTYRIDWLTNIVEIEAEFDNNYVSNPYRRFNSYSTDTSIPGIPVSVFISLCTYNGSAPMNGESVEVNVRLFIWNSN